MRKGLLHGQFAIHCHKPFDKDAQKFINVCAGDGVILNEIERPALSRLVKNLKAFKIWQFPDAIYPFVGANRNSHKYNLKDPRDSDSAYRLTFQAGGTLSEIHTANGFDCRAVYYATTYWNPSTKSYNDLHQAAYVNSFSNEARTDMGVFTSDYVLFRVNWANVDMAIRLSSRILTGHTNSTERGFVIDSAKGSEHFCIQNTTTYGPISPASGSLPNTTLYAIGALGNVGQATNRIFRYVSLGSGLTQAQSATYRRIVDVFQNDLGRA